MAGLNVKYSIFPKLESFKWKASIFQALRCFLGMTSTKLIIGGDYIRTVARNQCVRKIRLLASSVSNTGPPGRNQFGASLDDVAICFCPCSESFIGSNSLMDYLDSYILEFFIFPQFASQPPKFVPNRDSTIC